MSHNVVRRKGHANIPIGRPFVGDNRGFASDVDVNDRLKIGNARVMAGLAPATHVFADVRLAARLESAADSRRES